MNYVYALCAIVTLSVGLSTVDADVVDVSGPTFWNRSDSDAGFAVFDTFTETGAGQGIVTSSPVNSGNGVAGTALQTLELTSFAGLVDDPSDNSLYVHDSSHFWTLGITSSNFDTNSVLLQVKEQAGDGLSGFQLNGIAATSTNVYADADGDSITAFLWDLSNGDTIASGTGFNLTYGNGPFSFDAFDSFSVDISATAIPEPSSVIFMMAAGVGCLLGRRRRI